MQESEKLTIEEYNNIPVYYCSQCLSLRIKSIDDTIDYCDECGNTEIETTSIEEWKELYKQRYNKEF